jgi:uncharacterized protein YmfQ (DUF2313 family)
MSYLDAIHQLTKRLYPTGRAFKIPVSSDIEKLHRGLAASEDRAYSDAFSILSSALPDNTNFSAQDATEWEVRLGLITNTLVPLNDRKLAIKRKMGISNVPARQNFRFLEAQLQAAGFNVYVYENRFADGLGGYITKIANDVVDEANPEFEYDEFDYGEFTYGDSVAGIITKIANHIDESSDQTFNEGANLRSTFFVGASPVGIFADVDANRKNEFRQLILRIKPVQMLGYLFINYV